MGAIHNGQAKRRQKQESRLTFRCSKFCTAEGGGNSLIYNALARRDKPILHCDICISHTGASPARLFYCQLSIMAKENGTARVQNVFAPKGMNGLHIE
jgi:hypothetical protein